MRPFVVSVHDATPAFARETRFIIRDLAPLVGRALSFGVVPNWHNEWPLESFPEYCHLLEESSDDLLLHGYSHVRQGGRGATTLLADGSDEMNGLDADETKITIDRGQHVLREMFGKPAHGFLAPAWQRGHVSTGNVKTFNLQYVAGFFSLESAAGNTVPLSTWTWDCSRWGWTGHIGHGLGWMLHSIERGVPTLAIHPRDIERGYWPKILRLTRDLLASAYEPATFSGLLGHPC